MRNTSLDPALPVGKVTIVDDFLPAPSALVPRKKTVRITMEFTEESIAFFKNEAVKHDASYQAMIRNLVDSYAKRFGVAPPAE
jgi:hypothetical protein